MARNSTNWNRWFAFFDERAKRPMPRLDTTTDYSAVPASLARSLAVFQLGESGGGTVVAQARQSRHVDEPAIYADCLERFVAEEHRHADLLAMCVRMLGGDLLRRNWTAGLFVFGRRLMGLRLKVLVLLAAEVVGICYYMAIAAKLPPSPLRQWLSQIVDDERAHLEFHSAFLRSQITSPWRRRLFVVVWRLVMTAAGVVVMLDHRRTIRDLGLGRLLLWDRWMAIADLAEKLVVGTASPRVGPEANCAWGRDVDSAVAGH